MCQAGRGRAGVPVGLGRCCPPHRPPQFATFATILRRGSANASGFHSFLHKPLIQFRSSWRARCAPTHAVRCFYALPRREAHTSMHIRVCRAPCRFHTSSDDSTHLATIPHIRVVSEAMKYYLKGGFDASSAVNMRFEFARNWL